MNTQRIYQNSTLGLHVETWLASHSDIVAITVVVIVGTLTAIIAFIIYRKVRSQLVSSMIFCFKISNFIAANLHAIIP